jgi:uncharacterized BrkB/YihY/UPF0761 family membrane protein
MMYILIPIVGSIVLFSVIFIFLYKVLSSKKHPYTWFIIGMLIIILSISTYSVIESL